MIGDDCRKLDSDENNTGKFVAVEKTNGCEEIEKNVLPCKIAKKKE